MKCDDPRAVMERLEWLRHYYGKSQKVFAGDLGVMPTTYSNWCRQDYGGVSLDGAKRLYKVFGISLDFLYFGCAERLPAKIRVAWEVRP